MERQRVREPEFPSIDSIDLFLEVWP